MFLWSCEQKKKKKKKKDKPIDVGNIMTERTQNLTRITMTNILFRWKDMQQQRILTPLK